MAILIFVGAGCSSSPATPPGPVDAGDFCPPIAGTCAQAFFYVAYSCFSPSAHCVEQNADDPPGKAQCWDNGARDWGYFNSDGSNQVIWQGPSGQTCMTEVIDSNGVGHFSASGRQLDDDETTGNVLCPDGSKVYVGASFMLDPAVCPELGALLLPGCNLGNCARPPE